MHRFQTAIKITTLLAAAGFTGGGLDAVAQTTAEPAPQVAQQAFGFGDVTRLAEELVRKPYEPDRPELPPAFRNLSYDQYRDIRFRPEQNLWRDEALPFQIQMFSRGFLFLDRVTINIVGEEGAHPLAFTRDLFDYGKNNVPTELPGSLGFAGFRILYPLLNEERMDEVAVFLGASYFRAIGQHQNYGVSARGLAIGTGLATPEEFPVFREFWIVKPKPEDSRITIFALLDSKRAAGAYQFVIEPGLQTVLDVKARVILREPVEKLGVAPLTSMFYHGEVTDRFMDDFRPEVHDSDGLLIETGGGERIWRPLVNPIGLQITQFAVTDPRGFGLFQRDRDFDHYQDTEAIYHTRPSVWVETVGKWGEGVVELVEIPSQSERNDNIVAFWTPAQPLKPGTAATFDYRLHYALNPEAQLKGGRTIATRIGAGGTDVPDYSRRKFVVDFTGPAMQKLDPNTKNIEAVCNTSSGRITPPVAHHNRFLDGWRLFFELTPEEGKAADLRCFLRRDKDILTETWVFKWAPT
ncbi:MAG: glucan biosynthesis protein [Woeseiaceae bacterium]